MRVRVLATPVVVAAVAMAVAACGSSGSSSSRPTLTLGQEFPAMQAAVRAATSAELSGSVLADGRLESLDMILTRSGSLSGWVTQHGRKFIILVTGGKPYIKINRDFLDEARVPAAVCATVCGKYLQLPPSSAKSLTSGLSMTAMADQAFGTPPTKAEGKTRLVAAQYRGQPAWFGRYHRYTVYIARTGKPYLLAMTGPNGQVLRFSGWNTASVPGPPPASQVVTPAQL